MEQKALFIKQSHFHCMHHIYSYQFECTVHTQILMAFRPLPDLAISHCGRKVVFHVIRSVDSISRSHTLEHLGLEFRCQSTMRRRLH